MSELIGFREYARRRGCSLKSVQKAIASGRINAVDAPDGTKKIDPMKSDADWEKYTQHNKCPKKSRQDDLDNQQSEDKSHISEELKKDASFMEARRVREVYLAKFSKLDFEEKIGTLVNAEEMKLRLFQAVRVTRDAILNIPNRISHELAAESDATKIHQLMTQELHNALDELSRVK